MDDKFIIPLNGLAAGESRFSWSAGKEFFDSFENSEILDAELNIEVRVEKSGRYLGVDCEVEGQVTVDCDRCLDELVMPIDSVIALSVKYGSEENGEEHQEGEREIVFIPEDSAELDLGQVIYDYVCLSLPMQRVHEPGGCNPAAMKCYGAPIGSETSETDESASPFAALKDMFR